MQCVQRVHGSNICIENTKTTGSFDSDSRIANYIFIYLSLFYGRFSSVNQINMTPTTNDVIFFDFSHVFLNVYRKHEPEQCSLR